MVLNSQTTSNASYAGQLQLQLEVLRDAVRSIEAITTAFAYFHGDNPQLDTLIQNIHIIFQNHGCSVDSRQLRRSNDDTETGTETEKVEEVTRLRDALHGIKGLYLGAKPLATDPMSSFRLLLFNVYLIIERSQMQQMNIMSSSSSSTRSKLTTTTTTTTTSAQLKLEPNLFNYNSCNNHELSRSTELHATPISNDSDNPANRDIGRDIRENTLDNSQNRNRNGDQIDSISEGAAVMTYDLNGPQRFELIGSDQGQPQQESQNRQINQFASTSLSHKRSFEEIAGQSQQSQGETAGNRGNNAKKIKKGESTGTTETSRKLFATDWVVKKVLSHLSNSELTSVRRVNKRLNFVASRILSSRRRSNQMKFTYDWPNKTYMLTSTGQGKKRNTNHESNDYKLKKFHALLEKRKGIGAHWNFPCSSFAFTGGTLRTEDLHTFFHQYGEKIKHLSLEVYCPPSATSSGSVPPKSPNLVSFMRLFRRHLLKITKLELSHFPPEWEEILKNFSQQQLKSKLISKNDLRHLKALRIIGSELPSPIFKGILRASVNLESVSTVSSSNLNTLPIILTGKKFHLLKKFMWSPKVDGAMQLLSFKLKQLEQPPSVATNSSRPSHRSQLESLCVCLDNIVPSWIDVEPNNPLFTFFCSRVSTVLKNILVAGSSSLKTFWMASPVGSLPHFEFPVLVKVKTLKIGRFNLADENPNTGLGLQLQERLQNNLGKQYFPVDPTFELSVAFPNVTTVKFDLIDLTDWSEWDDYFRKGSHNNDDQDGNLNPSKYFPLKSVKTLVLEKHMRLPKGWLLKFRKLCPCVETLEIDTIGFSLLENAESLWRFNKLKNLKFSIDVNTTENFDPALDSVFTGFTQETVMILRESSIIVSPSTAKNFRKNASVADLGDLEKLEIEFMDKSQMDEAQRENYTVVPTKVAALYGFNLCPKLRIPRFRTSCQFGNNERLKEAVRKLSEYVRV